MTLIETVLIAVTQAISELYPISSSGHLILLTDLLKIEPTVILLTSLHLGSGLALTFVYRKEIIEAVRRVIDKDSNEVVKLILGIIPVAIIGILFGSKIEEWLYGSTFVAINLIFWGVVMIFIENLEGNMKLEQRDDVVIKDAFVVGIAQVLSLIPGTSRSGITTMAGMLSGVRKSRALDFSFMIGIPLLFGAFFYETIRTDNISYLYEGPTVLAIVVTFILSLMALKYLRRFANRRFLTLFGIYRIILGSSILFLI